MRDAADDITRRGAGIVVVGNGGVDHARDFHAEQHLPFPIYTDPGRESYRAAGLRRDLASTLNPKVLLHGVSALRQGFRQTKVRGDPWQQGGAFVIGKGGTLKLAHVSGEAGDHPPVAELIAALDP